MVAKQKILDALDIMFSSRIKKGGGPEYLKRRGHTEATVDLV